MDLDTPFRGSDAVKSGDVTWAVLMGPGYRKVGFDTFVSGRVEDSALLMVRALLVRGGPGATATGWSACVAQGLDVASRPWPAEMTAPGQRLAPHPGTVVWQQRLPADDVTVRSGVATTTPLRTAFDLARRTVPGAAPGRGNPLPLVDAVAAADALARLGSFTGPDLASFAQRRAGIRGISGVGRVADLLDPGADSPPETRLRLAVILAGLPRPVCQFPVPNGGPRPWLLDLAWPELRVALEYDGRDHAVSDRRGRDLDRLDALRREGWIIIVVTARQAARRGWVPDRVREAIASRGWTDPRTPSRAAS